MSHRWIRNVFFAGFLLLVFIASFVVLMPTEVLVNRAVAGLESAGYKVRYKTAKKVFPLGVMGSSVVFSAPSGNSFSLDEIKIQVPLISLLSLDPRFDFTGCREQGKLRAVVYLRRHRTEVEVSQLDISALPFTTKVVGRILGRVSGGGEIEGIGRSMRGNLRFDGTGVGIRGLVLGGIPLPDGDFKTSTAAVSLHDGKSELTSLSLEGDDGLVRVQGVLDGDQSALSMELMPNPEIIKAQSAVFALLAQYQVTPGHYRFPLSLH